MRWLANFGILVKIVLASVPLLLILGGFGAYSTHTMSELAKSSGSVNVAWKEAAAAISDEKQVLMMRDDLANFLSTSSEDRIKAVAERAQRIGEMLTKRKDSTEAGPIRDLLVGARKTLDEFASGAVELAQIQGERNQVLQQGIVAPAAAIDKVLVETMQTSYHDGDAATAFYAGSAIAGLAKARGAVQQFLQQGGTDATEVAHQGVKEIGDATSLITANATSRFAKRQVTAADKYRAEYADGIKRLVETTRKRDELMDTVVNQRADRLIAALGDFSRRSAETSESVAAHAREGASAAVTINIVVVAIGIAAALIVSLLLGRSVTRPITTLVAVTRRLANGDSGVAVPFLDQRDEVGSMAQAIQVFKKNAAEMELLRAERQEAEAHAATARKAEMQELADSFETAVGNIVDAVSTSASELEAAAGTLTHTAETTQELAGVVANASEAASSNVQSVATATEELTSSVREIARQVQESGKIAGEAVHQAENTDARISELSRAAGRIGDVVKLITAIAEQTNLLALNATIEAARAGDAGRGFAVVAQEVKALAAQTAKATDEIGTQIAGMQSATRDSVAAIQEIAGTIGRVSQIASTIAAAVEEQGAATQEIARSVQQASHGTAQVAANITNVNKGATETGSASGRVLASARSLSSESNRLKTEVKGFLAGIRVG
jgi:methyl-accepting chemotaxis protein